MYIPQKPETKKQHLSAEHEETIKATLPLVGSKINEITPLFYSKMFTAHPELIADTFNRGNQKHGDQPKALAASIATFATMLVDPDAPDPVEMLARIGHKHVSLGITEDQYQIVHDNLFAAIVEVLGADVVTPDVAEAWDAVYWLMARVLIDYESALYTSDSVAAGDVFRRVVVKEKNQLPGGAVEFVLESPEKSLTVPQPGQYTSVGVRLPDGARQLRQYSIVKGSEEAYRIVVQQEGEVSQFLHENVKVGDYVEATLPAGDLVLQDGTAPVILVSQGIGSTPMTGILAHLAETAPNRKVTVLHADKDEDSFAQRAEVTTLVERLPHANLHTFFRAKDQRIDVEPYLDSDSEVYLCGGNNFLQNLRSQLNDVDAERIHFEMFSPNDWLVS